MLKTVRHHLAECPRGSELVQDIEPVEFDFIVYRQEKIEPCLHTRVNIKFDPDNAPTEDGLRERIRQGIEAWVKATQDGKDLYDYAGDCMNFGDLMAYDGCDQIVPFIDGCISFDLEPIETNDNLTYDTSLCGIIED